MGELTEASNRSKGRKHTRNAILTLISLLIAGCVIWWAFIDDNGSASLTQQVQVPSSYKLSYETYNRGNFCVPYDVNLCQNSRRTFENVPQNMNKEKFKELLSLSSNLKFENVNCVTSKFYTGQSCSAEIVKNGIKMTVWYDPSGNNPMLYVITSKIIA